MYISEHSLVLLHTHTQWGCLEGQNIRFFKFRLIERYFVLHSPKELEGWILTFSFLGLNHSFMFWGFFFSFFLLSRFNLNRQNVWTLTLLNQLQEFEAGLSVCLNNCLWMVWFSATEITNFSLKMLHVVDNLTGNYGNREGYSSAWKCCKWWIQTIVAHMCHTNGVGEHVVTARLRFTQRDSLA